MNFCCDTYDGEKYVMGGTGIVECTKIVTMIYIIPSFIYPR